MQQPPFHLAFPVSDLAATRRFYTELLDCTVGRESDRWIDFNFHGHQITAHLDGSIEKKSSTNQVDGKSVPVRHFGAILAWDDWQAVAKKLETQAVSFLIEPHIRFAGEPGEQATLFLLDPSGNGIEFKSFRDSAKIFATD